MTTQQKVQLSSAEQALRIMDADGEAAMCHFIASIARRQRPIPPPEPPRTAILDDGSTVHFIKGAYIFHTLPFHLTTKPETRKSSNHVSPLPDAFQTPLPLFIWPNQLNLHHLVLSHLSDLEKNPAKEGQDKPDPALTQQLLQALNQAINTAVPTLEPTSVDIIDHLGNYMDDLGSVDIQPQGGTSR